jgi:phage/plasmid primase-like uncharacterized protein
MMKTVEIETYPDGRMTPANAALYLGLTVKTLATMRCKGTSPKFIKRGRIFYFKEDLDKWLEQADRCTSTAQARFTNQAILKETPLIMNAMYTAPDIQGLASAVELKETKQGFIGNCPLCGYKNTFTVSKKPEKVLVYCHACNAPFNEFKDHFQHVGLWEGKKQFSNVATAKVAKPAKVQQDSSLYAEILWNEAIPIEGTHAQAYLHHRKIALCAVDALRFHPRLKHTPSGLYVPAMIAKITDADGHFSGIHRTYLDPIKPEKVNVPPAKMMLGKSNHGCVRLSPSYTDTLAVAEGIETALSVMQETNIPTWATLSTSGMKSLSLSRSITRLIICADHDTPGIEACNALYTRAIQAGISVTLAIPPQAGDDFNDVLRKAT